MTDDELRKAGIRTITTGRVMQIGGRDYGADGAAVDVRGDWWRVQLTRPTQLYEEIGIAVRAADGSMIQVDHPGDELCKAAEYVRDNNGECLGHDGPDDKFIAHAKVLGAAWLELVPLLQAVDWEYVWGELECHIPEFSCEPELHEEAVDELTRVEAVKAWLEDHKS